MSILKNKNILINIASIAIIFSTLAFYFLKSDSSKTDQNQVENIQDKQINKYQLKYVKKLENAPVYDYQNMLALVEECRQIKTKFYSDFNNFITEKINLKSLKNMLEKLQKERDMFRTYLYENNVFHNRTEASRKRDSLKYYFRVIEDNLDEVKNMIEKFSLNIKLKINDHINDSYLEKAIKLSSLD
ncbi:hypothetical protein KJ644_04690 [Candidatus Dependentiae bacterium]|nr:hypothetical protein [Candidatus Dependentiae bacterium]MBU4387736.1 hypothetical protein [Candidatus Dependentiae bacterium]MCG2756328.1 hypothetical protein [Candidatus Dependentiae bacterium]